MVYHVPEPYFDHVAAQQAINCITGRNAINKARLVGCLGDDSSHIDSVDGLYVCYQAAYNFGASQHKVN